MVEGRDACLKCTLCISACPVYRQDDAFEGPKMLGPEWDRRRLAGDPSPLEHVEDCTFCQLCELACPVGVPIAHLIQEQKDLARQSASWRQRLRDGVLTHPEWVARFPQLAAAPRPISRLLSLSVESQRPKIRHRPRPATISKPNRPTQTVGLLVDCFDRGFDQQTVAAATSLLALWGFAARAVPQQSLCCGAAAYASGRLDQARGQAQAMRRALATQMDASVTYLITLNATCDGTIAQEWEQYLGVTPLSQKTVPFHQFALDHAPDNFWRDLQQPSDLSVPVWTHTTCRGRRRGDGALSTLAMRAGLRATPLSLECCGAAGSYAFKAEHQSVAHRMASVAKDQMAGVASPVWTDSGTCAIHISQVTGSEARHPAYWLWDRYQQLSALNKPSEL